MVNYTEFVLLNEWFGDVYRPLIVLASLTAMGGGFLALVSLFRKGKRLSRWSFVFVGLTSGLLTLAYFLLAYYHFQLRGIEFINIFQRNTFNLFIPFWIENERLLFWIWSYSFMVIYAWRRFNVPELRPLLAILLAIYMSVFLVTKPFDPFPELHELVSNYLELTGSSSLVQSQMFQLVNTIKSLVGKYYLYNTSYMWTHPPLVFISYSAFTINFASSLLMLRYKKLRYDRVAYSFGKFGYFVLTVSMLLGYPWALEAWEGTSWWWSPIIGASFMLWFVYTAYLHSRIYITDKKMWWLTGALGVLGYLLVVFSYVIIFLVPGVHTYV